jgi:CBS domain containing-hemolysin-like protein
MLVIGSNIVTIIGSALVGSVATTVFGDRALGIVLALVTFLIIIFGEIFPKVIGEQHASLIARVSARPILILTKIFSPIIWVIEKATLPFKRQGNVISEEELKLLSELGSKEGSIEPSEEELIQRVFTLNDLTAKDIMTPRMVIEGLPAERTLREVSAVIFHKPYSRYPIYSGTTNTFFLFSPEATSVIYLKNINIYIQSIPHPSYSPQ